MYLDFSRLKSGRMKQPVLQLRTLSGKVLGAISYVSDLHFDLRYADISEISFRVPYMNDGKINPLYSEITSYRMVYTEHFGIYVLASPEKSGNGMYEEKEVHGYSIEKLFEKKRLYLDEGTYNFWNPVTPDDTLLGRIVETDPSWHIGYVDPRLIGCYRTFDQYDSDPLTFCYNNAVEKYQCAVVFDVYNKTINAYDSSKSRGSLPIYLSYNNLVDSVRVSEVTDEIITKLRVYGADGMSIRDVNPTGMDYIVNLDYFISKGDLDVKVGGASQTLAERVKGWEMLIASRQQYYTGLVASRASCSAQKIAGTVALTDLNGELDTLTSQQSAVVQAIALGLESQSKLDDIYTRISAKRSEIAATESDIADVQSRIDDFTAKIEEVNGELAYESYFSEDERKVLNQYLIENEVTEETFVATDVDTSVSGASSSTSGSVAVNDSEIMRVDMDGTSMYVIDGGMLRIENAGIMADIQRATLEQDTSQNKYILTAYLGSVAYGNRKFPSGMVTMSGSYSQFSSDIVSVDDGNVHEDKGNQFSFTAGDSTIFFTVNVNDYQKYSVEQELYDFGIDVLSEKAWPVYEFELDSANFLYQKEFAPFKDKLELGKSIHLSLGSDGNLMANIIGISIGFDNPEDFSLIFANRYQKKDGLKRWMMDDKRLVSASHRFDANKYIYNRAANKTTQVSQLLDGAMNAAVNTIIAAENKSVVINGAGILVGGDSDYQLRIVDNMLAISEDGFKTAKLAIGRFATDRGTFWGINTDLLMGKVSITENLIIEAAKENGTMMFKVDPTGAWLYNSTFVLQSDDGGKLVIDPKYGLLAGTSELFTTNGDSVIPAFIDDDGNVKLEQDGMPKNTNFYIDSRDGSAYFRGTVYANAGKFAGELVAASGTFTGTVRASKFLDALGNDMMDNSKWKSDYLSLSGLEIKDSSGNTVMKFNANGVTMYGGAITWGSGIAAGNISGLASVATSGKFDSLTDIPKYIKGTYIDFSQVSSPHISGNDIGLYGGRFTVYNNSGQQKHGFIGHATGAATETITNGIAMSAGDIAENISFETDGNYIIATTEGVRLHSSKNGSGVNLYLTPSGAYVDDGDSTIKLGDSVAVFG